MKAKDIMVMKVMTVGPEATVREAANILFQNRISALPVVDDHVLPFNSGGGFVPPRGLVP